MAGGIGSRFWPVSRSCMPKQFLDILGLGRTFIQLTYDRFSSIIPAENFYVVTNLAYKDLVKEQLPLIKEENILLEPLGRNTAPCIAYAAFRIKAVNAQAEMIVTPADHLIIMQDEFHKAITQASDFVKNNHDALMTIGIKPTRPDTGYGYIQVESQDKISKVKTFTEKPKAEMAKIFMDSGEFMWNAGIFIWKVSSILKALEEYQHETYSIFNAISEHYNTPQEQEAIGKVYSECRPISIDFGVMEKAQNVYVLCSEFGWSDIGTWVALYQHSQKDEKGNVAPKKFLPYQTSDCIVKAPDDKLVVIQGLEDYIVVDTEDTLMVCPKKNEQNIKQYIDDARFNDYKDHI